MRRLWAPRLGGERLWSRFRRRTRWARRRTGDLAEVADPGCALDVLGDLFVAVGIVLVVLFVVFVGLPLLLALLDVLVIVLLTAVGIVARVLFRRPWLVEATGGDQMRRTWRVVGWRASREAVDDIADTLAHGHAPPPGHDVSTRPDVSPTDG